jgi:hypothetical protein
MSTFIWMEGKQRADPLAFFSLVDFVTVGWGGWGLGWESLYLCTFVLLSTHSSCPDSSLMTNAKATTRGLLGTNHGMIFKVKKLSTDE